MTSSFRRSVRAACFLLLAMLASAPAWSLEGDRIRPSVGLSYAYNSNIYYLDDRSTGGTLLRNGQRGDRTLGLQAGLDVDHYVSRQSFTLRSQATQTRHATYDNLDFLAYNARGTWNWVAGERWDGDAGLELNQVASNLYDFANVDRSERNLRDQQLWFASAMLRMSPDWKLRGALRYSDIGNSLQRFNTLNLQEWTYEAGSRFYSKGTDDFVGVNLRIADGRLPNRIVTAGATIDNAYRQYTLEGVVDYQLSGLTRLSGNLGYTSREYQQLSQRNFDGFTGRLSAVHAFSSKTSINGAVFREIGAWEDLTANFVLTQGVSLTTTQAMSDKLAGQLRYSFRTRAFLGDPNFVLTGTPTREDAFHSLSFSLTWRPTRLSQVVGAISRDTRSANDAWAANGFGPFNDFSAINVSLTGQLTF
jgi:exopolysaccharide biosynthesis operon protein EpsL